MHRVYISVGSNMGDKETNLRKGLDELNNSEKTRVIDVSRFYKTEPVDYTDQDWFVNAAACIETELDPEALLTLLKQIEKGLGRDTKTIRFGPRVIDLDILLYDDQLYESETLTIPHERMHERAFVLVPLCDIAADIIHPVKGKSMKELLGDLDDEGQDVIPIN